MELEHSELGQLVDRDPDLVRAVDCHAAFSGGELVRRADLVQVFEIRAAQHSVDQLLVLRVPRRVVARHVFNHLVVARVSEEFEHVSEQRFRLVRVACAPGFRDLVYEPLHRGLFVVDRAVNR